MDTKIIKLGGYVMAAKGILDSVNSIRSANRRKLRRTRTVNLIVGASIGTALGAAAGILFAPRPGSETREKLSQKTSDTMENIKKNVGSAKTRVADTIREKSAKLHKAAESAEDAVKEG